MGPLVGTRVLEFAGIGALPFAGMLLTDLGADTVRIDRPGGAAAGTDPTAARERYVPNRGRRSVVIDMKAPEALDLVLDLVDRADVLLESHRPGVMERLGLGPDACLARNPRLVYARLTGWGQTGPWSARAGHDINYISLAGALASFARPDAPPSFPLNLLGDLAGGGLMCAFGVVSALVEVGRSGRGQVVDAAMVDGVATHLAMLAAWRAQGRWAGPPGTNFADGGAPYYAVYATQDGGYVAVGALEAPFYAALLAGLGLRADELPDRDDRTCWPALADRIGAEFARRTRDEWAAVFEGTDACVTPVLTLEEAAGHPHLAARGTYVERGGVTQPAPSPRFSRTPCAPPGLPDARADDVAEILAEWAGVGGRGR